MTTSPELDPVAMAMQMHQVQFDRANRLQAEVERLRRTGGDARPRSDYLTRRKDSGHWLKFIDGKVTGCACGFVADIEADSGYGDSVLDHFEDVVRAEEREG